MSYTHLKAIIDRLFASIFLILFSPVMIICAMLIKWEDPEGSILFTQKRIGLNNKLFNIYKFRSMTTKTKIDEKILTDEERMLKVGNIFRRLSLDEFPQFFNILKGEMSFIGPRPMPLLYLPYFNEDEICRHNVKPGLSGWAQVNGRNNLNWDEKFKLDIDYVKCFNFTLDIKILFLTIWKVFKKSDVVVRGANDVIDFHTYRIKQREEKNIQ